MLTQIVIVFWSCLHNVCKGVPLLFSCGSVLNNSLSKNIL